MKVTYYGMFSDWFALPTTCCGIAKWLSEQPEIELEVCEWRPGIAPSKLYERAPAKAERSPDEVRRALTDRFRMSRRNRKIKRRPPEREGVGFVFGGPPWLVSALPGHERLIGFHVTSGEKMMWRWQEAATGMNQEDAIVTPSEWARQGIVNSGVTRPVHIVSDGISGIFRPPETHLIPSKSLLHFSAARLPMRKGTMELMEALTDRRLESFKEWTVHIYANEELHNEIYKWAEKSALPNVYVMKDTPEGASRMLRTLRNVDIVVQPSRGEGFGRIPLEALAAGVPVVATNKTGMGEYLKEDTPGAVIVPAGDLAPADPQARMPTVAPKAIADALIKAMGRVDELKKEAERGAEEIGTRWRWNAVLSRSPLLQVLKGEE